MSQVFNILIRYSIAAVFAIATVVSAAITFPVVMIFWLYRQLTTLLTPVDKVDKEEQNNAEENTSKQWKDEIS